MKKVELLSVILIVALFTAFSVSAVFAETYYISDGLKYMLNGDDAYLAGIEDDRTALDVPAQLDDHPVTATTMDFASGNTSLESVSFENAENISIIGSYGFYNCSNLKSANLGSYVSELYRGVFRGCTSLETVELSDKITEIPYECFYGCTSLGQITLGRNITSIQSNSFTGCPNLIIRCYTDSYAHHFAVDNKIAHILIDGTQNGDVNGDGAVDILDATEIQKYAAESTDFTDEQFELGDINKDGYCDVIDALLVQKSVIGAYEIPPIVVRY